MLTFERPAGGSEERWGPIPLECKWVTVMEHYQFICRCLMTHEIKEYLCTVASATVCLESRLPQRRPSFLFAESAEQRSWTPPRQAVIPDANRRLSASKMYPKHETSWKLMRACVCVRVGGWIGIRMYRRTSNMAGLTYPPTALTALKVRTVS